ncbi:Cystathionine beta-lyase [Perkinsela sp. CCAP 1560/4]|nr:Cystathionine beta-lyase [Perkinsela sp. CCAP 1560/4]|eukprot:KNH06096.1 Cystathionine beta-lyase [Perkinsela sp. CCAP 1560/4]
MLHWVHQAVANIESAGIEAIDRIIGTPADIPAKMGVDWESGNGEDSMPEMVPHPIEMSTNVIPIKPTLAVGIKGVLRSCFIRSSMDRIYRLNASLKDAKCVDIIILQKLLQTPATCESSGEGISPSAPGALKDYMRRSNRESNLLYKTLGRLLLLIRGIAREHERTNVAAALPQQGDTLRMHLIESSENAIHPHPPSFDRQQSRVLEIFDVFPLHRLHELMGEVNVEVYERLKHFMQAVCSVTSVAILLLIFFAFEHCLHVVCSPHDASFEEGPARREDYITRRQSFEFVRSHVTHKIETLVAEEAIPRLRKAQSIAMSLDSSIERCTESLLLKKAFFCHRLAGQARVLVNECVDAFLSLETSARHAEPSL